MFMTTLIFNEGQCFVLDVVDKKNLFSNYLYLTGANKPIIDHFEKYVHSVYHKILKKRENMILLLIIEIESCFDQLDQESSVY